MWILWRFPLGRPGIHGLLPMDIGLKIANVTVQVVSIMKFVFIDVTKLMDVDIPLSGAHSSLGACLASRLDAAESTSLQ